MSLFCIPVSFVVSKSCLAFAPRCMAVVLTIANSCMTLLTAAIKVSAAAFFIDTPCFQLMQPTPIGVNSTARKATREKAPRKLGPSFRITLDHLEPPCSGNHRKTPYCVYKNPESVVTTIEMLCSGFRQLDATCFLPSFCLV